MRLRVFYAFALIALVPTVALAQPAAPDPIFEKGRLLLDQGKFADACVQFKTTWDTKPTPGKAFNLSVCEEKQGHVVRAGHWMTEGMALLEPNDSRRAGAIDRRTSLEKRAAYVTIVLGDPSLTATEVLIDSEHFDLGTRLPIDPGDHEVVTKLQGHDDGHGTFSVAEAEVKQVTVQVGPVATAASSPLAPATQIPPNPARDRQRIAGIALMVGGGACLIGFGSFAALVGIKHTAFESAPAGSTKQQDLARSGKQFEIGEAVFLGLGIAAGAAGVAVFATAPSASKPQTGLRVSPTFSVTDKSGFGGLSGSF